VNVCVSTGAHQHRARDGDQGVRELGALQERSNCYRRVQIIFYLLAFYE